jgi:nitrogenase molybdenum-iron protein beta chain
MERVLPILHCGSGCETSIGSMLGGANGGQNSASFMETALPCTQFCDKDVVFGGTERLESLIEYALKFYNADIFVVIDGCTSQIVGDDIEEVVSNFKSAAAPVIFASLPGFKGKNTWGHSQVLNALLDQYLPPAFSGEKNPKQVNVWGIVPYYDPFWLGNLEKLNELLEMLGLKPNIIYGRGKGIKNIDRIPAAEFNLLLSPWIDLDIVQKLEQKYGAPYLHYPNIPTGPTETAKFIRELVAYAHLNREKAERYIEDQEDRYWDFIKRNITWLYDDHNTRNRPREFYFNASAGQTLALTKYLVNDLGLSPRKLFISEEVPEEHHERIGAYFDDLELEDNDFEIIFTNDGGLFEETLKSEELATRKSAIFGACYDLLTAEKNKLIFVAVSAPFGDHLIGPRNYFGYDGGLNLAMDLYNDATDHGMAIVS